MKKILAVILVVLLALTMTACGKENSAKTDKQTESTVSYISTDKEDSAETTKSEVNQSATKSADRKEWKKFLKDYGDWVERYIEITKKYEDNPNDLSLLSDYTEMLSETAKWSEKAEKLETDLKDTDDYAEFYSELLRIVEKLLEAGKQ